MVLRLFNSINPIIYKVFFYLSCALLIVTIIIINLICKCFSTVMNDHNCKIHCTETKGPFKCYVMKWGIGGYTNQHSSALRRCMVESY